MFQRSLILVAFFCIAAFFCGSAWGQQDADPGVPDTITVESKDVSLANTWFSVTVALANDQDLGFVGVPLTWDLNGMVCDSVSFVGSRVETYTTLRQAVINNTNRTINFAVFAAMPPNPPTIPAGSGMLFTAYFSLPILSEPRTVVIDSMFISPASYLLVGDPIGYTEWVPQFNKGVEDIGGSLLGRILVYSTRASGISLRATDFDTDLPALLTDEGFRVVVRDRASLSALTSDVLSNYDQLWFISTENTLLLTSTEIQAIQNFRSSGKAIMVIGDDCAYTAPINQFSHAFNTWFGAGSLCESDHCGGQTGCLVETSLFPEHEIWEGVSQIEANSSEGRILTSMGQVIARHNDFIMTVISATPGGRVAWDATFYRFSDETAHPDLSITHADNAMYVRNLARWLSGPPISTPLPPIILLPEDGDTLSFSYGFYWQHYPGALQYRLQISEQEDFSSILKDTLIRGTSLNAFIFDQSIMLQGHEYYWHLAVENENGWGAYSKTRSFITPAQLWDSAYCTFDSTFTSCPGGDVPYKLVLRDKNGNPVVGYGQMWLNYDSAYTDAHCLYDSSFYASASNAFGEVYFRPRAGIIDSGEVRIMTRFGVMFAATHFMSYDTDGDMTVTQDDWVGDESNDYDRDGKTDWLDYNLFVQHLGHNCSTPDTSLHLVMQLYANPPSGYLSEGDTSEISLIITNYSQVVCTLTAVRFNYFGFNIGYDNWIPFDSLIESIPLGIGQSDTIGGIFIIPQGNHGCIEAVASVLNRLEKPRCQLNLDSQGENGGPTPGDSSLCEAAIGDAYGFPLRIHIEPSLPPGWRYTVNDTIYNEIGTLIMSVVPDENALPGESGSITAIGIDAYGNQVGSLICEYRVPEAETLLADLVCTNVSSIPDIPYGGQNTRVSGIVANQGDVPANMVIISLIDETLGTTIGDTLIDQILPGQMKGISFNWQPQCGQQAMRLVVDAEDEIAESDEDNNYSQLINVNPICQDDIYIISSMPAIEAEINDTIEFEITVINMTEVPQTMNLTLSEPVNQWISLSDNILWVPNGGSRTTAVTLITPNQCENLAGDYSIVVTATSDDPPIIKAHEVPLHISSDPIIHDLVPINGQTTAFNDVTILWRTSTVSTSKVVYWIDGQSEVNEVVAVSGATHNVVLPDLLFNTQYYWYAESVSDCGSAQSEVRSFIVGKGVVFTNSPYEYSINRDYNQLVSITIRNEDDEAHTVLVEAINMEDDLILGFLGSGSIDESLELNPGETKSIPLAIHAQDAMSRNYAISLRLISDGETPRPITDYALAAIHINIPDIRFHFQEISYDTTSMIRTLQIVNDGDLLTDLKVEISQMEGIELLMQPSVNHARLQRGQALEFKVIPIFEENYAGSPEGSAVLAASAAEHVEYLPIDEVCTKQIFRATVSNVIVTVGESAQATWYCTNRPHIRITLTFPSCSQLPKYVLLNSKFEPQVSNWDVKPHNVNMSIDGQAITPGLVDVVPEGTYVAELDPTSIICSPTRTTTHEVDLETEHLNGGHYVVNMGVQISLCYDEYGEYICAESQEEADAILAARPYITANPEQMALTIIEPTENSFYEVGQPVPLKAQLVNSSDMSTVAGASVEISTCDGQTIPLGFKTNGYYEGSWTPSDCHDDCALTATAELCGMATSGEVSILCNNELDLPKLELVGVDNYQYDFGEVAINTDATWSFAIKNSGGGSLQINTITVDDPAFQISSTSIFPLILPKNETETISILFRPELMTEYATNLIIKSTDPANDNIVMDFKGVGAILVLAGKVRDAISSKSVKGASLTCQVMNPTNDIMYGTIATNTLDNGDYSILLSTRNGSWSQTDKLRFYLQVIPPTDEPVLEEHDDTRLINVIKNATGALQRNIELARVHPLTYYAIPYETPHFRIHYSIYDNGSISNIAPFEWNTTVPLKVGNENRKIPVFVNELGKYLEQAYYVYEYLGFGAISSNNSLLDIYITEASPDVGTTYFEDNVWYAFFGDCPQMHGGTHIHFDYSVDGCDESELNRIDNHYLVLKHAAAHELFHVVQAQQLNPAGVPRGYFTYFVEPLAQWAAYAVCHDDYVQGYSILTDHTSSNIYNYVKGANDWFQNGHEGSPNYYAHLPVLIKYLTERYGNTKDMTDGFGNSYKVYGSDVIASALTYGQELKNSFVAPIRNALVNDYAATIENDAEIIGDWIQTNIAKDVDDPPDPWNYGEYASQYTKTSLFKTINAEQGWTGLTINTTDITELSFLSSIYIKILHKGIYRPGTVSVLPTPGLSARIFGVNAQAAYVALDYEQLKLTEPKREILLCTDEELENTTELYICIYNPDCRGSTIPLTAGEIKILYDVAYTWSDCPIDLELQMPSGKVISKDSAIFIQGGYIEYEDSTKDRNDLICWGNPDLRGTYILKVKPEEQALLTDSFSLYASYKRDTICLAKNEKILNIDPSGYYFSFTSCAVLNGHILITEGSNATGITIVIADSFGNYWRSVVTDDSGYYHMDSIPNGDYTISVVTPLGYQADQEVKQFTVSHVPVTIDFNMTKLDIIPNQRSRGYWAMELNRALCNIPHDYTKAQFSRLASLIAQHFNNNLINPVENYVVPQPATQDDSLNVLKKLLNFMPMAEDEPYLKRIARGELVTMMLNVVAGKVSQTHIVTADGMTLSQAITYSDMLVNGIACPVGSVPDWFMPTFTERVESAPYLKACYVGCLINVGAPLPAGTIPADIMNIAYRHAAENPPIPTDFDLAQNYPNPFNPNTQIDFSIATNSHVSIEIYNVLGQRVTTLLDEERAAGTYSITWDGKDQNGSPSASGVYFYRLVAGDFVKSRKMLLMK